MATDRSPGKGGSTRRSVRFTAVLLGLVLALAVVEVPFRVVYFMFDRPIGQRASSSVYLPYVGYFRSPASQDSTSPGTDQQGFLLNRNDERRDLHQKEEKEFRVFIVGGSTVASGSSEDGDTLSALIEARLLELFRKESIDRAPRVINAGVDGYFSAQEFLMFNFILLPLRPDYVIFLDGTNDFVIWGQNNHPSFRLLQNNYHDYQAEFLAGYNRAFSLGGALTSLVQQLGNYSAAMDFVYRLAAKPDRFRKLLQTRVQSEGARDSVIAEYMDRHVQRYFKNIRSSIGVGQVHGVPIAYFFQPTLLGEAKLSDREREFMEALTTKWHNVDYFEAKRIFYQRVRPDFERLRQTFTARPDLTIRDLSRLFADKSAKSTYYVDHVHYNAQGRRLVANAVFSAIKNPVLSLARDPGPEARN